MSDNQVEFPPIVLANRLERMTAIFPDDPLSGSCRAISEPIVNSPENAFRCFIRSDIDVLAIGNKDKVELD